MTNVYRKPESYVEGKLLLQPISIALYLEHGLIEIGNGANMQAIGPGAFAEVISKNIDRSIRRHSKSSSQDRLEVLCNYTPFAISYFEAYHVLEDGRVVDIWPVLPRGPESRWLLDLLERGE